MFKEVSSVLVRVTWTRVLVNVGMAGLSRSLTVVSFRLGPTFPGRHKG